MIKINKHSTIRAELKSAFNEFFAAEGNEAIMNANPFAGEEAARFEYQEGTNVAYLNGDVDVSLADSCRQMLDDMKDQDEIIVNLNSEGGVAFTGMAVANMLAHAGKKTTVNVMGMAASAASLILQGATVRRAAEGSIVGIHEAYTGIVGNARELRNRADKLEVMDKAITEIYASRVPKENMTKVRELMAKDIGLTGRQAVDIGLADSIIPKSERDEIKQSYKDIINKGTYGRTLHQDLKDAGGSYAAVFNKYFGDNIDIGQPKPGGQTPPDPATPRKKGYTAAELGITP